MAIIAFIGKIGSSKTLSMVRYMYHSESRIYSNFVLDFPIDREVYYLDREFFDRYSKSQFDIFNSIVALDEIAVYYDSRGSGSSPKNKMFSRFITQSRKRKVNLIFSVQDSSVKNFLDSGFVDLRARKLCDYFVLCKCFKLSSGALYCVNDWYNNSFILCKREVFKGNPYFNLYDSNQIIDLEN